MKKIEASELINLLNQKYILIDVRSPGEFAVGHIIGAHSVPLLADDERALVGTLYKREGKEAAIFKGLEFIGLHMKDFVALCLSLSPDKKFIVYCSRGGMRSRSVGALLSSIGSDVYMLEGGYKAFRAYGRSFFSKTYPFIVVGGRTGSGKTRILKSLEQAGEYVIDLEGLACHKGSVFGGLGHDGQPTQEHFENKLMDVLIRIPKDARYILIEDESRSIGRCKVPDVLWSLMRDSIVVSLDVDYDERVSIICDEYNLFSNEEIVACVLKLQKYLGSERTTTLLSMINNRLFCVDQLLMYYDKKYAVGMNMRDQARIRSWHFSHEHYDDSIKKLITYFDKEICHTI